MRVCVGNFPLELNNMGLEKKKNTGQAVSIEEEVLGIGQVPRDSALAASVRVIHAHNSGWRVQCVFFFFNYFI
jgi:hypothetical protein